MKTKRIKMVGLLMMVVAVGLISQLSVYAQVNEKEAESIITRVIEKDNTQKEEEIEIRYPNKLTAKEPPKDTNGNGMATEADAKRNKGVATSPSKAAATLTENVDNKNSDYPIYRGSDEEKKPNKYAADARQFISFKTKNGKTFHLIINHDENTENVMLLTEVSEDDLLNFVETKGKKEEPVKEVLPKEEPVVEVKPEKKEKSDFGTYLVIFIVGIGVLSAGYYFKVIKRKEEEELKDFESDESDEEYYSEYEGESEEQKDVNQTEELQNQAEETNEVEYEDIDEEDLL